MKDSDYRVLHLWKPNFWTLCTTQYPKKNPQWFALWNAFLHQVTEKGEAELRTVPSVKPHYYLYASLTFDLRRNQIKFPKHHVVSEHETMEKAHTNCKPNLPFFTTYRNFTKLNANNHW